MMRPRRGFARLETVLVGGLLLGLVAVVAWGAVVLPRFRLLLLTDLLNGLLCLSMEWLVVCFGLVVALRWFFSLDRRGPAAIEQQLRDLGVRLGVCVGLPWLLVLVGLWAGGHRGCCPAWPFLGAWCGLGTAARLLGLSARARGD